MLPSPKSINLICQRICPMEALRVLSRFINMTMVLINRKRNKMYPAQPKKRIHDEDWPGIGSPLNKSLLKKDINVSGMIKEAITKPLHLWMSSLISPRPKLILNKSQNPGKRAVEIIFNRCQKITCSDERAWKLKPAKPDSRTNATMPATKVLCTGECLSRKKTNTANARQRELPANDNIVLNIMRFCYPWFLQSMRISALIF